MSFLVLVCLAAGLVALSPGGRRIAPPLGWRPSMDRLPSLRRGPAARPEDVTRWIDSLGAELRAGRPPRVALVSAGPGICPRAVAAAALGGDIPDALRQDARDRRAPLLAMVAACWSVAEGTGAGLAASLDQVLAAARADAEVRAEIAAQLAGPRATARMLAVLPVIGLALGTSLGASPVSWLTGSPLGLAVMGVGLSLIALGLWWTSRMVGSVERALGTSPHARTRP